jgi:hypothetical protein
MPRFVGCADRSEFSECAVKAKWELVWLDNTVGFEEVATHASLPTWNYDRAV